MWSLFPFIIVVILATSMDSDTNYFIYKGYVHKIWNMELKFDESNKYTSGDIDDGDSKKKIMCWVRGAHYVRAVLS